MPSETVWKIKSPSPLTGEFARHAKITPFLAQLLINRGIKDSDSAAPFLEPRLARLPDPMLLMGMEDALRTILKAIERGWKITVFGDYDADGITATALLVRFFASIGIQIDYYIPDRLEEGYGLNPAAIREIGAGGTRLIITVDCGISNQSEIILAKDLGIDVLVTDHHLLPADFHEVCPVINPNRKGCPFPFKPLAGVGVAFFLAVALRSELRRMGRFRKTQEPDLREYLDLVAIGTVADRVPLVGLNRTLARIGISIMSDSKWPGIRAMMDASGLGRSGITGDDIAFRLAPRLNAPGRLGDPRIGMKILNTEDISYGMELANEMNRINNHRQALELEMLEEARNMVNEAGYGKNRRTFVLASEKWHKGVLGIVASKLVDEFHRPVILFSIQNGVAVGSGRSIKGFDLYEALVRLDHLMEKYGGHSRAAGLTIGLNSIDRLSSELEDLALGMLSNDDMIRDLEIDMEVSPDDIDFEMVSQINALSPFGEGNPEPVLLLRSMEVLGSRVVGENHLRMRVSSRGRAFDSIGFGMAGRLPTNGETLDIAFVPEINQWQGYNTIQLKIVDFSVL